VRWAERAYPEIGSTLARTGRGKEVGLVPVGAIEQHGPHLPTGTDTIVATALCEQAGDLTDSLVLPAISVGVSYGHGTVLPGTLSLSPDLLVGIVQAYARWAAASGLLRLLFVNAHLGNTASLGVATDTIRLVAPDLRVGVVDCWAIDPAVTAEVTADGSDIHANLRTPWQIGSFAGVPRDLRSVSQRRHPSRSDPQETSWIPSPPSPTSTFSSRPTSRSRASSTRWAAGSTCSAVASPRWCPSITCRPCSPVRSGTRRAASATWA
jgi:hypothetical protein